jgi:hypothetical protein
MRSMAGAWGVVLCAVLAGCATVPPDPDPNLMRQPVKMFDSSHSFGAERRHLGPDQQPRIGLALSGGGTKAAVFSHGVLHGLNDAGILDHVDLISTASGGGYAAYWLMSKRMEALENPGSFGADGYRAIFADCFPAWYGYPRKPNQQRMRNQAVSQAQARGMEICNADVHYSARTSGDPYRWQAHLLRWPDVFKPGYTPVISWASDNVPVYTEFNGIVATLIEGLFSPIMKRESYVVSAYQYGIERAWGLNPSRRTPPVRDLRSEWEFTNATEGEDPWTRQMLHVRADTMRWDRLRSAYAKVPAGERPLPLWVLNTTQGQKAPPPGATLPQPDPLNLFELTPFGYGSPRWGYADAGPDQLLTLVRGVRASAAFADPQGIGNPGLAERIDKAAETFTAAKWGVPFKHRNAPAETLHLSDGGGADNLALVSAVRRGLSDVIVADTAEDGRGTMEDLCWSRRMLEGEGFAVEFRALRGFDAVCEGVFAGTLSGAARVYDVDAWVNPVIHGKLTWPDGRKVTNVWLIKAAWNENDARAAFENASCGFGTGEFNCLLAMFWGTRYSDGADARFVETFPQHGTAAQTLNGSPALVLAYRELGRMAASQLERGASGQIALRNHRQCYQARVGTVADPSDCFLLP